MSNLSDITLAKLDKLGTTAFIFVVPQHYALLVVPSLSLSHEENSKS